ncbi:MAG: hypothetical protein MUF35_02095 [Candidatus Nanopelagicales bacterium]|nr:hypothetical protein [Candidatus Nanopelagicales bacterium]
MARPIGVGTFLVCLAATTSLLARAEGVGTRTRAEVREQARTLGAAGGAVPAGPGPGTARW